MQDTDERSIGGNVVAKVQVRPKINKLAWIICFLYFCLFCILFSGRNNLFATYFIHFTKVNRRRWTWYTAVADMLL